MVSCVGGVDLSENVEELCLDIIDRRVYLVNEELFVVSSVINISMISEFHECCRHLERYQKQRNQTANCARHS